MDKPLTILKISLRQYNKLPYLLTQEEKEKVLKIYYDYY
tara:strand:+ start:143 stop:259 length:117 start_codon:yes stop_codon:yes gene_type:complete